MDRQRVLRQRLTTQRVTAAPLARAADVVRLLGCVQSQERDHAFYSLGLRSRARTYAAVRAEHDAGAFLRTHILRPTWHFVAPEDLRWILALTSPRVEPTMGARHRQLGLDDARYVGRALAALEKLLTGRNALTRKEIGEEFARSGSPSGSGRLPAAGEQLGHLLLLAELRGLVCSGPLRGVHHSYALVDEVVPPTPALDREEALARLARRFFAGHGPASVRDFTRWSSLTVADTRAALSLLGDALEVVEVEGAQLYYDPSVTTRRSRSAPAAVLFPTYDEAVLTYPSLGFEPAGDHPFAELPDPFWASVVVGERNVGLWKRRVRGGVVEVEVRLAPSLEAEGRRAVRGAAQQLAEFLEADLSYTEGQGRPPLWGGVAGHPARRPRRGPPR